MIGRCSFERRQQLREQAIKNNKAHVMLSPNEDDVIEAFRVIVDGLENTIGATSHCHLRNTSKTSKFVFTSSFSAQIPSMLREPKLAVFYSPPKHDLSLKTEEEKQRAQEEEEPPPVWPDTG